MPQPPEISQGVRKVELESWRAFADFIRDEHATFPTCVYRGQADADWPVESSLDRLIRRSPKKVIYLPEGKTQQASVPPASPDQQLKAFMDAARGRLIHGEEPRRDETEWWALGQQHGLCTPLLDFTSSPFAALFFAFEENFCQKGKRIYEPKSRAVIGLPFHISKFSEHEGKPAEVQALRPVGEGSYRLMSQGGLFVKMPPGKDLETWVRENFEGDTTGQHAAPRSILTKIVIANDDRVGCLRFLCKMNISRHSLFPDLDGSAAHINALWEMNFDTDLGFHLSL